MDPNPYKFDTKNPRLVVDKERSSMIQYAAGALFIASIAWYQKRYYRIDQNVANMAAFTIASAPASFAYSNFMLNDAETEAACINNERELQL